MLASSRTRRDQGWRLIKQTWLAETADDHREQEQAFITEFAPQPGETLATAYEKSVLGADLIADRLRYEADRVAHKAEAQFQLTKLRASRAALEQEQRQLAETKAAIERDWATLISPLALGAEARTPAQLRAWLLQRDVVVATLKRADQERQSLQKLDQQMQTHLATLSRVWDEAWGPSPSACPNLAEALEHCERFVEHQEDLAKKTNKLETQLESERAELATAQLELQTSQSDLATWRSAWSSRMARLGLEPDADPKQADVVLTHLADLFDNIESAGSA